MNVLNFRFGIDDPGVVFYVLTVKCLPFVEGSVLHPVVPEKQSSVSPFLFLKKATKR